MPPFLAMETAISDSVTVSMAAETSGMFSLIWGVSQEETSTMSGVISEWPGSRRTSSKVSPSGMNLFDSDCMADVVIIGKDK